MKKKKRNKRRGFLAAGLITAMIFSAVLPAWADTGFVFEDWDAGMTKKTFRAGQAASPGQLEEEGANRAGSASEAEAIQPATASMALLSLRSTSVSSLGNLWDDWDADFSFLDGSSGVGTKAKPYQIKTKNELMGLSQLAAMGMRVDHGEGDAEIVGSYEGAYFKLMSNLDLGGMDWNPIGFYRDSSEMDGEVGRPFCGHFDGNGKTVSNFRIQNTQWPNVGFFGALEDAVVENLTLKPGKTVTAKERIGILAGTATDSRIYNCTVEGSISGMGTAGGMVGVLEGADASDRSGSVAENCTAKVTIHINSGSELYAGGIAGKAAGSSIVDCRVETGDNNTARIQGTGAAVGGIAGFQNNTDIYNSFVSGTIGGAGSLIVGGITGTYASGHLKVARFEGTIGQSGTGSAGRRGTFIGHREAGDYFRYGDDVAWLFADSEAKIAANVCGSQIPDDNEYTYGAHVGFSHSGDLFYTLVQGGVTKDVTDTYYYEELEQGILSILELDLGGADSDEAGYELDHFAPNDAGRPTRGYLVTIPQIDTVSNGTNYYDVAVLEVRGNSAYYKTLDKERRGAIAPGKSVTVTTSPNNTEEAKFQMEGVPTYTKGGSERETTYVNGGEYTFTMPEENTEVKAVYKKVAVRVSVVPSSYSISVVEERTGNRKNPVRTTKVTDPNGKLIATYINGVLEQGTQIQPVAISAVVDANNDVADNSVKWSVDDPDLIKLLHNDDEDSGGYTKKSASIQVNLDASFFTDTIRTLEAEQAAKNYQYPIPDTIYGAGHQNGGVAVLTASTRPAASFENKPCTGNAKINVTFQIKDKTYVAGEGASLDRQALTFVVTRRLTGNRKTPEETIQVTAPQSLTASFSPDFFDKKDISWSVDDPAILTVNGENKAASVTARKDAKWIRDLIASDEGNHANHPYEAQTGSGSRTAKVTVLADDMLGNRQTASCEVTVQFVTKDESVIYVEGVTVSPSLHSYTLSCKKTGLRTAPVTTWSGVEEKKVTAEVLPVQAFNRAYHWSVSDDSLQVGEDGTVTVNTAAKWIQEADKTASYQTGTSTTRSAKGTHTAIVTATTEDGGFAASCRVELSYELTDSTYTASSGSGSSKSSGGGGGGGGGSSSGVSPSGGIGPAGNGPAAGTTAPAGSVTGTWINTADGQWAFTEGGRTYHSEWAYVHNPYAGTNQSSTDWFRFDETGHMVTGWFTDADGNVYYLWPISDGTMGHMVTGWQWIAGEDGLARRYYFNSVSDGTKGALQRGGITPDGETVNENGQWTVDGVQQLQS